MATDELAAPQNHTIESRPARQQGRANPLFSAIVGANVSAKKAACAIASQIEQDLIRRAWPTGSIYGSEGQLADRFGVCRSVMREAVRILDSRGTARMRRGPNGGLVVLAPELPAVLEAIHRYVTSHRGVALQGNICLGVLQAVRRQLSDPASVNPIGAGLNEFMDCLIAAADHSARSGAEGHVPFGAAAEGARSRAENVFRLLLKDLSDAPCGDHRLGSELDLCERYGACRSALRQAVRVLEFEGIAVSTVGRGKGLMTQTPDPSALCQFINCYFAAAGVTPSDAMHLFKLLSLEVVSIAARAATATNSVRLREAQRILRASNGSMSCEIMQLAEESQFGPLGEPLIDILLRCTKGYSSWWSAVLDPDSQELGAIYRVETLTVISAILSRDPTAAAVAQAAKVDRLATLI